MSAVTRTTEPPHREFEITDEHVAQLSCVWQWGVRVTEAQGFLDGVAWFDEEDEARTFADETGSPLVRQPRIYWSGEWEPAAEVEEITEEEANR